MSKAAGCLRSAAFPGVARCVHRFVVEVCQTERFAQWLQDLFDLRVRAKIQIRIERLLGGNPGDSRLVRSVASELRTHCCPGYSVYWQCKRSGLIVFLAGSDKLSMAGDVEEALMLTVRLRRMDDGDQNQAL